MPLKLILIRHAKSAWDDPLADDHARVLNDRGRASASAVGRWLAENGHTPDEVLSSDSARTRETVALIGPELPAAPKVSFLPQLYHAAPEVLMDTLMGGRGASVALVAHNPGIGSFAHRIVTAPPSHPRFIDYPTAATLVAEFDADGWDKVNWRQGRVAAFITPRELV